MLKIVVLISGSGSNLQAIINAIRSGTLPATITGVLANKADAGGLQRAQNAGLNTAVLWHGNFPNRESFDAAMQQQIDAWSADIVVLAGFMRILTPAFVQHYANRLVNIHPSLLPKHKGLHTHRRALDAGDTQHGCSVHLVTAELDDGPIIAHAIVPVLHGDTEATLAERVHTGEHLLYPYVLTLLATKKLTLHNNRIFLHNAPLTEPLHITPSTAPSITP